MCVGYRKGESPFIWKFLRNLPLMSFFFWGGDTAAKASSSSLSLTFPLDLHMFPSDHFGLDWKRWFPGGTFCLLVVWTFLGSLSEIMRLLTAPRSPFKVSHANGRSEGKRKEKASDYNQTMAQLRMLTCIPPGSSLIYRKHVAFSSRVLQVWQYRPLCGLVEMVSYGMHGELTDGCRGLLFV